MKIIKEIKNENGKFFSIIYRIKETMKNHTDDFFEIIPPENSDVLLKVLKAHFSEEDVKNSYYFWGGIKAKNIKNIKRIKVNRKYLIASVDDKEIKYFKKAGFTECFIQNKEISKEPGKYFMRKTYETWRCL